MLYFNWCITFRSCLQPLLHYTLFTFVLPYPCYLGIHSQEMLSLLRPVTISLLPWTYALHLARRIMYLSTVKLRDYSGRVDCPQCTVPEQVW
jgi:hypothetical protein